eukprot:TRINITY_DN19032_c0_g1_i1.p1 TRINITY_DN19032_c0_g1~~TRINITY_DN19032_c0_g1_i1.p1  ORF type:complete len:455 (-),score=136.70 TRINITY_DN19032_c0_g1_i1:309-1673(-)
MRVSSIVILAFLATICLSEATLLNQHKKKKASKSSSDDDKDNVKKVVPGITSKEVKGFPNKGKAYAGYVNVNEDNKAHMFYWLFKNSKGKKDAPTIMWLQGGPGCSSLIGLLYENGPFKLHSGNKVRANPHSWNRDYNVLYVDNPVGSGFSYVDDPKDYIVNESTMADELYLVVSRVFEQHPDVANKFYIMGESYAGKYIPAVAHRISQANKNGEQKPKIKLIGLGIGNGMSDPLTQTSVYADFAFNTGLVDEKQRDAIYKVQEKIKDNINNKHFNTAWGEWNGLINSVMRDAGRPNSYDIRSYTSFDIKPAGAFFNSNRTLSRLPVNGHRYRACNHQAYHKLEADMMKSVKHLFPALLDEYKVVLYNGQFDFVISVPATSKFISTIDWPGRTEFAEAPRKVWRVNGKPAGLVRTARNLTQIVMLGAGHMVPYSQPLNAYRLMKRLVSGKGWEA